MSASWQFFFTIHYNFAESRRLNRQMGRQHGITDLQILAHVRDSLKKFYDILNENKV